MVNNLISIENELKIKIKKLNVVNYNPKIIAVSKTFSKKDILPLMLKWHLKYPATKAEIDRQDEIEKLQSF